MSVGAVMSFLLAALLVVMYVAFLWWERRDEMRDMARRDRRAGR